jgi:pseudaminic acid synthase
MKIADFEIGLGRTYIIAEISANHNQSYERAEQIVREAAKAGVDAIKLQTYTADTITIDSDRDYFKVGQGTLWAGRTLYDLYQEAYTPWDWQPKLKKLAESLGLHCFSSPFDPTSVDFLEQMDVAAYKIASPELVDLPLIQKVCATGKPVIMSTGMATLAEIEAAVDCAREAGCKELALLKCTSAYPAPAEEMNLATIPHLKQAFGLPVGLSDHTLGTSASVMAVTLGATILEKHFTLSREDGGPDAAFSLESHEMKEMVDAVRFAEKALGKVSYVVTEKEKLNRPFRRSLFAIRDIQEGDIFDETNVRSIRPAQGIAPKYTGDVMGKKARISITKGTPLSWDLMA